MYDDEVELHHIDSQLDALINDQNLTAGRQLDLMQKARELAGAAWTTEANREKEMDIKLALAFADILEPMVDMIERAKESLEWMLPSLDYQNIEMAGDGKLLAEKEDSPEMKFAREVYMDMHRWLRKQK